jgi:hypothetical protein
MGTPLADGFEALNASDGEVAWFESHPGRGNQPVRTVKERRAIGHTDTPHGSCTPCRPVSAFS